MTARHTVGPAGRMCYCDAPVEGRGIPRTIDQIAGITGRKERSE